MNEPRTPAAALLSDLAAHIKELARTELKLKPAVAAAFSEVVTEFLAGHWGGQVIYIPKDIEGKRRSRDAQIYDEYVGDNHSELARKYELSVQCIYRIVARERERRSIKQHSLPLGD